MSILVQEDTVDSISKLVAGELRGAVALLLLLAVMAGAASRWVHKIQLRLFGATATRLLSNVQLVVVWLLSVLLFYSFESDPLLHGIGSPSPESLQRTNGGGRTRGKGGRGDVELEM